MHKVLPVDRLRWIGIRFLDRNGRTFEFEGEIYRAIYQRKAAHVRGLFETGLVSRLVERGWLIDTEMTDLEVPGFGLVLRHRRAPFTHATGSYHWTGSLLLRAAQTYLDLNMELAMHDLCLVDGQGANIAQIDCCRPVWIDFGSIVPLEEPKTGLATYARFFGNPLKLLGRSSQLGQITRQLIRGGGIHDHELASLSLSPERALRRGIQRARGLIERAQLASGDLRSRRRRALEMAHGELPSHLPAIATRWGEYSKKSSLPPGYEQSSPRARAILEVLKRLRPKQVVDLACNAGFFSFMAARQGAEVLAVDYDEAAVEKLDVFARECREPLSVTSACFDVMREARQHVVLPQGDLVLALALTHHLSLSQSYPFAHIASVFARYSRHALVVEFMPNGCGGKKGAEALPEWYTQDNFLKAFQMHFQRVEIIPYDMGTAAPRTLVVCEGKLDRLS